MYSTCIFCHSSLGANESVEQFPIGRRLAFDAARGRLWVVCRKCERWNLSPLEERWEAIEECERLFSETRLRVSTDNIGMARARDGLELVRIGSPQRPEMAAWRYGDQFGRRRRKHVLWTGAGIAAAAGLVVLGPATGILAGSTWGLWNIISTGNAAYQQRRLRARIAIPEFQEGVNIRRKHLYRVSMVSDEGGWALHIPYEVPSGQAVKLSNGTLFRSPRWVPQEGTAIMHGDAALRAAAQLLPAINESGAKRAEVDNAVKLIGQSPDPAALFARYAAERLLARRVPVPAGTRMLAHLPKEIRLALEMATHEDTERRALEGELALLEDAWKQAEEIAAIADDMFVSDQTRAKLSELKGGDESG